MRRTKFSGVAATAFAALLAAACTPRNVPVDVPTPGPAAPKGVEGEWVSSDRVAVSRFAGGIFTTTATDTGNKLADGNYTMTSPTLVAITVVSRIRNTTSNVNCSLASTNQLNCTSSTGQQFVLMRRTQGADPASTLPVGHSRAQLEGIPLARGKSRWKHSPHAQRQRPVTRPYEGRFAGHCRPRKTGRLVLP